MEVNYINYFNEFEREYEVLKNASDDVLTVSLEIIHYIEKKLKEMGYKKDGNWFMENIIRVGFGAVRIYDNKKFSGLISLRFGSLSKHYNSLEEFLKD